MGSRGRMQRAYFIAKIGPYLPCMHFVHACNALQITAWKGVHVLVNQLACIERVVVSGEFD